MAICCPAVWTHSQDPISWQWRTFIPGIEMGFCSKKNVGRYGYSISSNALDDCCPSLASGLDQLGSSPLMRPCHNQLRRDDTHHKSCLVKIICVHVQYSVLSSSSCHKLKPSPYHSWVLSKSSLTVISSCPLCFQLWRPFDEVMWPAHSSGLASPVLKQFVCHTAVMVLAGSWRRLRVVPYIMIDEEKVDSSHRGDEGYYLAKLK